MTTPKKDEALKRALARILPEKLAITKHDRPGTLYWFAAARKIPEVLDTELLEICREIELGLSKTDRLEYAWKLVEQMSEGEAVLSASWQSRTTALAATKGIPIE